MKVLIWHFEIKTNNILMLLLHNSQKNETVYFMCTMGDNSTAAQNNKNTERQIGYLFLQSRNKGALSKEMKSN